MVLSYSALKSIVETISAERKMKYLYHLLSPSSYFNYASVFLKIFPRSLMLKSELLEWESFLTLLADLRSYAIYP